VLALRAAALAAASAPLLLGGGGKGWSLTKTRLALGTLTIECLLLYSGVALGRVLAYLLHAGALKRGWLPGHVVSDHLFLAASMLACLQAEAACALSDWRRARRGGGDAAAAAAAGGGGEGSDGNSSSNGGSKAASAVARQVALALVLLAAVVLYALTAADMYFTARYYHVPRETLLTALAVFAVFQAPVLGWLVARRVRAKGPEPAGAAAVAAVAVGAAAAVGAARVLGARRRGA
jgi:hypothetical protein